MGEHIDYLDWIKRLILMVILSPLSLFWGELFTRTFFPQNLDAQMNIFIEDPVIGFTYKPDSMTFEKGREYNAPYIINSLGIRDREYGPKKEGIFRILLLGDSFSVSHGLPIEESLSKQLERELQSQVDLAGMQLSIEVVNGAAGGYSPYNYWKAYERWKTILDPDVVTVGLSPDDYDSSNAGMKYVIKDGATLMVSKEGKPPKEGRGTLLRNIRKWLSWNSHLYILLRNYFYYNEVIGRISLWLGKKGEVQGSQFEQFMVPEPEHMIKAWRQSFSYLEKLHEETSADKVSLIIISIPLKLEIIQKEFQAALSASGLKETQVNVNQPLNKLSEFCSDKKIPLLDPRTALKKRNNEVPCYFVYDGHWNSEGVKTAAKTLAAQWKEKGLPPLGQLR